MAEKNHQPGENYRYPLIIKKLLATPLMDSPDREIVYSDRYRYTYKDFVKRIAMLANGLATLGLRPGETVAVFDYDSHRYLECFFAVPMMGSVLQTVNWRLSADQIRYASTMPKPKWSSSMPIFFPFWKPSSINWKRSRHT